MADPILELEKLNVGYGNICVAQDINFNVKQNETFGLIGINGAGKTSIIKSIIGLKQQQSGDIKIFGQTGLSKAQKSKFGYLPERFDPPWFLTGEEFVKFNLKLYDRPFEQDELYEYCDDIRLDKNFLSKRMNTYSKGMRQKLGLVATLMSGVELLILDEPMSGLDPIARVSVKQLLVKSISKGQTVFLCSHILSDLDELCDNIAILHDSKIQFLGAPADLKKMHKKDSLEQAFLSLIGIETSLNINQDKNKAA